MTTGDWQAGIKRPVGVQSPKKALRGGNYGVADRENHFISHVCHSRATADELSACINLCPRAIELLALARADALDNIGFPLRVKIDALLVEWQEALAAAQVKHDQ